MAKAKPTSTDSPKKCFIITPISQEGSDIRVKAFGLIEVVLRPILEELGYKVYSPLDLTNPGSITNQVISALIDHDLVVANLTGLNPNVMYELAVRHAANRPVVLLAESETQLPFDIYSDRTLKYTDTIAGVEFLKPAFRLAVISAIGAEQQDNPIYRAISRKLIQTGVSSDFEKYVLDTLDEIQSQMNKPEPFKFGNTPEFYSFLKYRFENNNVLAKFEVISKSPIDTEELRSEVIYVVPMFAKVEVKLTKENTAIIYIQSSVRDSTIHDSVIGRLTKLGYEVKPVI